MLAELIDKTQEETVAAMAKKKIPTGSYGEVNDEDLKF